MRKPNLLDEELIRNGEDKETVKKLTGLKTRQYTNIKKKIKSEGKEGFFNVKEKWNWLIN